MYELKIVEKRLNMRQREQLDMLFVEGKWFYNHVLKLHETARLSEINTTCIKKVVRLDRDKNEIVQELRYLSAAQKQAILARMRENERAIMTLVRKKKQEHGSLRFKSELTCVPLRQYGMQYKFKSENKVKIQGVSGAILVRGVGQLRDVDDFANANLVRRPDGYYLKVVTFTDKGKTREPKKNGKEIGLDFGVKTSITTSEGEKLDVSVGESDRLKRLQRELSRRARGSNNRYRTIGLIRREYQKLSNRKRDKANKIVHRLKQYSLIAIQDENLSGWQREGFGRKIQHSCLGLVKAKLKALPQTVVLDRWIPTTKWCPGCQKKHPIGLAERTFLCGCGYSEDRDVHAARNMLAIKDLVFQAQGFVPAEHREITLEEFEASAGGSPFGKPGR